MTKRVPEVESEIMSYPRAAFLYAKHVIKGRWVELEEKRQDQLKEYKQYINWVDMIETEIDSWDSDDSDWLLDFDPNYGD